MNISQLLTKLKTLVYSKSETDSLLGGKASSSHTHTKSQITDFPTIPSKVSQLTNDSGFITGVSWANVTGKPSTFTPSSHTHTKSQITDFPSLATVATSGSYNDLSNKPTIPTDTNQLTNGAGFITSSGSCNYANSAGSAGSCTESAYMGQYKTITYDVNRLQYYNISTPTTSGATNNANPNSDWFYHLLMSHSNSGGWYGDIALCFHSDTLAFRRIVNGTDNGWCYLVKNGRTIVSGYEVYVG